MKIRVLSDLHLENDEPELVPHAHADLIVLAGDIHNHAAGPRWAAQTFDDTVPVVYVPGNHEYYGGEFGALESALIDAAAQVDNVHVLNNAALVDPQARRCGPTSRYTARHPRQSKSRSRPRAA